MKKLLLVIIVSLISLVMIHSVYAFGPASHMLHNQNIFSKSSAELVTLCRAYQKEFDAGSLVADITVRYYTLAGGQRYKATHNHNFVGNLLAQATNDAERCFVYGVELGHYAPDYVSHNKLVPDLIRKYNLANIIIHPMWEGLIEAYVVTEYPTTEDRAQKALNILLPEDPNYNPKLVGMIKNAISMAGQPIDVEYEIRYLDDAIDTFYDKLFFFQDIYAPIAGFVRATTDMSGEMHWFDETFEIAEDISNNWLAKAKYEPHGFTEITKAEAGIQFWGLVKIPTLQDWDDKGEILLSIIRIAILLIIIFVIITIFRLIFGV